MSKERTAHSSGMDPFSPMGTGLIPDLVNIENIGPDIHKQERSTSTSGKSNGRESDAPTEIIESEDDVNLEPDSTTNEERRQEEYCFPTIEEKNRNQLQDDCEVKKHLSKRVWEDPVELLKGEKGDTYTIENWWKCKHCTGFLATFFINNDVADKYIDDQEKREKERRKKECKELVETSFHLYGDEE